MLFENILKLLGFWLLLVIDGVIFGVLLGVVLGVILGVLFGVLFIVDNLDSIKGILFFFGAGLLLLVIT